MLQKSSVRWFERTVRSTDMECFDVPHVMLQRSSPPGCKALKCCNFNKVIHHLKATLTSWLNAVHFPCNYITHVKLNTNLL
jgi:hypothetical protein